MPLLYDVVLINRIYLPRIQEDPRIKISSERIDADRDRDLDQGPTSFVNCNWKRGGSMAMAMAMGWLVPLFGASTLFKEASTSPLYFYI